VQGFARGRQERSDRCWRNSPADSNTGGDLLRPRTVRTSTRRPGRSGSSSEGLPLSTSGLPLQCRNTETRYPPARRRGGWIHAGVVASCRCLPTHGARQRRWRTDSGVAPDPARTTGTFGRRVEGPAAQARSRIACACSMCCRGERVGSHRRVRSPAAATSSRRSRACRVPARRPPPCVPVRRGPGPPGTPASLRSTRLTRRLAAPSLELHARRGRRALR
jgi:hypothetical protein